MVSGAVAAVVAVALLAGCDEVPPPDVEEAAPQARLSGTPSVDRHDEPVVAVLPLVPATATTLTVTDLDEVRRQLGVPDLTSGDLWTDRRQFWERAATEAPLLTEGRLRAEESRLQLDYGFTEDDVDWEARFTGPDGAGWVLALRPDLPLDPVRRAVADGVPGLAGAQVLAGEHLVVSGTSEDPVASWATDPTVVPLVGEPVEATYVRRGCVPVTDALGPDATADQQDRVRGRVEDLDPLAAVVVELGDHLATVRTGKDRSDLFARLELGEHWPVPAFARTFRGAVGDPATGRIGYDVADPSSAASLVLTEELPFAVCAGEVAPLPVPTGP